MATEKQLRDAYGSKTELLEEMIAIKPIEELCELYNNEEFVKGGAGKTNRFYEAITEKGQSPLSKKTYIALWNIRSSGEIIEANSEVFPDELGDDFERLLEIGAIGELMDKI